MMEFESSENLNFTPKNTRSKYRDLLLNVMDYFRDNPDKPAVKIKFEFGADAANCARQCTRWLKEDEDITIISRSRTVFFLRGD